MNLYQLAYNAQVYGDHAGWWLVVSDDLEKELAGPSTGRTSPRVSSRSRRDVGHLTLHGLLNFFTRPRPKADIGQHLLLQSSRNSTEGA